jgi:LPS sulfotransferase NodH
VRKDKVSQAVSLWKAIQTGRWREDDAAASTNGNGHQNGHRKRELQFHFELIEHLVQQIEEHELAWERFFAEVGKEPYSVVYEDLAAHYETTVLDILQYLGVSLPENHTFAVGQMKRQADTLSEEWVRHYYSLKRKQHNFY